MNDAIVESINANVKKNDTLYHLGDWSFGGKERVEEFYNRLNCHNILLCYGNHDHHIRQSYRHLFSKTFDFREEYIDRQFVVMCHYSLRVWQKSHHGSFHLYGHSHGSLPGVGRSFDIGWDVWRRPLEWSEVKEKMLALPIKEVDHHNSKTQE